MKKKVIKKYARELLNSIQYYGYGEKRVLKFTDNGYPYSVNYDSDWQSRGRVVTGKRARQLVRAEVIEYIVKHIDSDFMMCGGPKFNAHRKYIFTQYWVRVALPSSTSPFIALITAKRFAPMIIGN